MFVRVHIPEEIRKKLDDKGEEEIILGCLDRNEYKVWVPKRNLAVISGNVRMFDGQFPARILDTNEE